MPNEIHFLDLAKFQEKQRKAWFTLLDPKCKYLLYGGAASGGKSYFLRWAAIGLGMYYYTRYGLKNIPIGLFSQDYPTLKDRQVIKIKNEIPEFLGTLKESRDEGYAFIGAYEFGSFLVLLRNLDDPSKYKSAEFAAILVEETTENTEQTFDDLRFRLRYGDLTDVKFVGATNPGGVGHGWVKRKWVKPDAASPDHEQSRFYFVPAKYDDNKYTTQEYVNQLESLPEDKRRAYKEGDWDIFAGQYFSEWRDSLHTVRSFIPDLSDKILIGGMDWGRAKPFSFHLAQIEKVFYEDTSFFRLKTFCEVYGTDKTPAEWSEVIKEKLRFYNITLTKLSSSIGVYADPAIWTKGQDNSTSIADQFIAADERWRTSLKPGSNDRIGGWENMHHWLSLGPDGLPYWQVSDACPNLIRTLPELIHDDIKVEDVDTEGEDHAPDDQRYMLKRLKWIDGKAGGYKQRAEDKKDKIYMAPMDEGQQISVDIDAFT